MRIVNNFEIHYYFGDDSHDIDAFIRNRCEAELLAIITEVATEIGVDARILADAVTEGGFRDFWKLVGDNSGQITVVLVIVQILLTIVPMIVESENEALEKEFNRIKIEETTLNIEKLKRELESNESTAEKANQTAKKLSHNLKIIKRKSNLYATLNSYPKIEAVGFNVVDNERNPVRDEISIPKSEFGNFVLGTNKLPSIETEATIEIISPVLKEGRYKWKGIFEDEPISFEMLDAAFRDAVLLENIPFQHGTSIVCVLRIGRVLDELGDVKISGYAVTTVIEKIDSDARLETQQGKQYRHAKKQRENQGKLF